MCVEGYQGKGCQDAISASNHAAAMVSFLEINVPQSLQPVGHSSHAAKLGVVTHVQSKQASSTDCSGHGTLANSACFCDPGWTGDQCASEVQCSNSCNGNGQCSLGLCYCEPGYTGSDCSVKVTCVNDCSGNGECWHGRCSCNAGYEGSDCSDSKPRSELSGLTVTEMVVVSVIAFAVGLFLGLLLKHHLDARKKDKFNEMLKQDGTRPFVSAP